MIRAPVNVSAKKATLVTAATLVLAVTTVIPTANRATAAKSARLLTVAALLENAPVPLTMPGKPATSAVLGTTNIPTVFHVNATVTAPSVFPVTAKANASATTTSPVSGATLAKKVSTISRLARIAIVTRLALWRDLQAVGRYPQENSVSARIESKAGFVISAGRCTGTSIQEIPRDARSANVIFLEFLEELQCVMRKMGSVRVSLWW